MAEISLEQLRDSQVRALLAWPFDFDLDRAQDEYTQWFNAFSVKPIDTVKIIAADSTGGLFILFGSRGWLLHVTSEGEAGIIATDLTEAIHLIVGMPNWRDVLKFSGGGKVEEMKRAAVYFQPQLVEDYPDLHENQRFLKARLGLKDRPDLVEGLYSAVAVLGKDVIVAAPDGSACRSLFNTFTIDRFISPG